MQRPEELNHMPRLEDSILGKHVSWNSVRSLCPECLKIIPGVVRDNPHGVIMEKTCLEHGSFRTIVGTDLDSYQNLRNAPRRVTAPAYCGAKVVNGCPNDCGLCPEHDQHTCLAILEVTSKCDLECPICLANSSERGRHLELAEIKSALTRLIRQEGDVCPLQLSGGEPTLHPNLISIIRLAVSLGFKKIELDTNGLALSRDLGLAASLREAGLTGVYLQMDGLRGKVSEYIRGRDCVSEKLQAIENCKTAGLQIVLSVTVVPNINDQYLWEMIQFGADEKLTGVNFQAVTVSGRFPESLAKSQARFTQGHFMRQLEEQSGGKLKARDFLPIPCPDTRCGLITYALIINQEIMPLTRLLDEGAMLDFSAHLSDWDEIIRALKFRDWVDCGCHHCNEKLRPLSYLLPDSDFFSIGYHGMMDAYNFDLERVRRCCVHEITSDGRLVPFCLYNIKYRKALIERK